MGLFLEAPRSVSEVVFMRVLMFLLIFVLSVLCAACGGQKDGHFAVKPVQVVGECLYVYDGDTVLMNMNGEKRKIRLYGIDAPEMSQEFGDKSRALLSRLVEKKKITVSVTGEDRYGRVIGVIFVDGMDVNALMLKNGAAWHYKDFDKSTEYAELESLARMERLGLWATRSIMAPWEYRKQNK